ncbi:uncharacterized protein LOC133806469 [Humulus lupulus]|uniref:uncharacterized protein LOC133806469 n=1 Tax=Humulus lupulus TaxID=3486 RepID=UPI002B4183D7|nr:uncharacterized protein LOC133806469 [Humulus lupulus]
MALQRTLKELATPDLDQQPLCIQYPPLDVNFELKSGLIHLLPSFHGLPGEDPNKQKEFHIVYSSMKSTADAGKEWLYYLPPGTVETWNGMKTMFLERYFPASKVGSIRNEICGIRQYTGESLYEYWERFKWLCASSTHHQKSDQLLIQYFYEGLQSLDRSMIDAASGGALVDKTLATARSLISNKAANSQQFGIRQDPTPPPKSANEVSTSKSNQLGQKLVQLTAVSTPARPPGFTLQQQSQHNFVPRPSQAPQVTPPPSAKPSTEDLINAIATNTLQFQQTTQASIKSLENQVGQLAASYNRLEAHLSNKFPSQSEMNPKKNASAVSLRREKQYDQPSPSMPIKLSSKPQVDCLVDEDVPPKTTTLHNQPLSLLLSPHLTSFPSRLKKTKKEEVDKEILDTFRKVEVNIPLLDAIKQVSRYAKFLK